MHVLAVAARAEENAMPNQLNPGTVRVLAGRKLAQDPDNRALRFFYAKALFQTGGYDAARYHVRQLMRGAHTEEEVEQLRHAYGQIATRDPWSFGLNFAILPSTNINNTSQNEFYDTPFGRFFIESGGDEETGIGTRLGGRLSYEQVLANEQTLTYNLSLNRDFHPDERLKRLDGTVAVDLKVVSLGRALSYGTYVSRYVYDGDADSDSSNFTRYGIKVGWDYYQPSTASLFGLLQAEQRVYDEKSHYDGPFYNLKMGYSDALTENSSYKFGFGLSYREPEQEHLSYFGQEVWAEVKYTGFEKVIIGLNARVGQRGYQDTFPGIDGARHDDYAAIGASITNLRFRIFGSTPKLGCELQQTLSNVALYEYRTTDCYIKLARQF